MTNETKNASQGAKLGKNMGRKTEWVKKNWNTANLVLTAIGVIGALVGLYFLIAQTRSLEKQTQILSEEYKATYRPYLAVEDIATQEGNGSSLSIQINVRNYGQVPATNVSLQKVVVGGAVEYDQKTGIYTFIYTSNGTESSPKTTATDNTTGVSVTVSGYVVALIEQDYPPDFIFFPGKEQLVIATVDKPTYQATVSETKLMYIALEYSYGLERYYYVAKATLQDGIWRVVENRGN